MGVIPALGIFSSREAPEGPNVSTETSQSGIGLQDFWNGEGGIRTHGAREDTLVFKTRAINHSTTSPKVYPTRIHKRILATCAASKGASLDESPHEL